MNSDKPSQSAGVAIAQGSELCLESTSSRIPRDEQSLAWQHSCGRPTLALDFPFLTITRDQLSFTESLSNGKKGGEQDQASSNQEGGNRRS
jgi:hypothetical protein